MWEINYFQFIWPGARPPSNFLHHVKWSLQQIISRKITTTDLNRLIKLKKDSLMSNNLSVASDLPNKTMLGSFLIDITSLTRNFDRFQSFHAWNLIFQLWSKINYSFFRRKISETRKWCFNYLIREQPNHLKSSSTMTTLLNSPKCIFRKLSSGFRINFKIRKQEFSRRIINNWNIP